MGIKPHGAPKGRWCFHPAVEYGTRPRHRKHDLLFGNTQGLISNIQMALGNRECQVRSSCSQSSEQSGRSLVTPSRLSLAPWQRIRCLSCSNCLPTHLGRASGPANPMDSLPWMQPLLDVPSHGRSCSHRALPGRGGGDPGGLHSMLMPSWSPPLKK